MFPNVSQVLNYSNPYNRAAALNRGLSAWWLVTPQRRGVRFMDLCGMNHGKVISAVPPKFAGAFGRPGGFGAINFRNGNDAFEYADNNRLDCGATSTIAFWVYVRQYGAGVDGCIITKFGAEPRGVRIDDTGFFVTESNLNRLTLQTWVTAGSWHHVVIVCNSNFTGYVDGVSRGTGTLATTWFNNTNVLRFGGPTGAFFNSGTVSFDGLIDDVRFYNSRVLSDSDVLRLYKATRFGYKDELNWLEWPRLLEPPAAASMVNRPNTIPLAILCQ